MNLFELSFIWFILTWSARKTFCYNLRGTDIITYKIAVAVERTKKKSKNVILILVS